MTATFTPGPWRAEHREQTLAVYQRTRSGKTTGRPICIVARKDGANARLIAAAPDLYDQGHRLAMLVLQSDSYRYDPDARAAVDHLLAIKRRIDGDTK